LCKEAASSYVESHLVEALIAGLAEISGNEELSKQLRARAKLRLITMSDEQLWELARLTSGGKLVEQTYERFKRAVGELIATHSEWAKDLP
jgi:hypothetical protein